jgi:hypothetical protein
VVFLKHGRRRGDGGAADDNAVTKACGVVAVRHDVLHYSRDHPPPLAPKTSLNHPTKFQFVQGQSLTLFALFIHLVCVNVRAYGHTSLAIGQSQVGAASSIAPFPGARPTRPPSAMVCIEKHFCGTKSTVVGPYTGCG